MMFQHVSSTTEDIPFEQHTYVFTKDNNNSRSTDYALYVRTMPSSTIRFTQNTEHVLLHIIIIMHAKHGWEFRMKNKCQKLRLLCMTTTDSHMSFFLSAGATYE